MTSKDNICFWRLIDPQINHWSRHWDCSGNVFFFLSPSLFLGDTAHSEACFLKAPITYHPVDYSFKSLFKDSCRVFAQTFQCVTWNEKKGKIHKKSNSRALLGALCSQTVNYRGCFQTADRSFLCLGLLLGIEEPAGRKISLLSESWFIRTTQV